MQEPPNSHELFKPIKNKIRSYDPLELISRVSKKIHEVENLPIEEWRGWDPWYLYLLIKWSFEFGGENAKIKTFGNKELVKLINMIKDFDGRCGSPFLQSDGKGNVIKFLRTKAYQQFWMQLPLGPWNIARQFLLFNDLSSTGNVKTAFKEYSSISILDFLDLSFLVWAWLSSHDSEISFVRNIIFSKTIIPKNTIDNYFNYLSLDISTAKTYLLSRPNKVNDFCFQLIEPIPFIEKPFFCYGMEIVVYSIKIFESMINNYIFNQIKYKLGSNVAVSFGNDFEKYIQNALSSVKLDFLTEKDLKTHFPNTKVTDYLIKSNDSSVFIEVKSQDINPKVVVFPGNTQLKNELEDSIVKATIQAITLINTIKSSQSFDRDIKDSEPFLFIVTYKNLYLGNGKMMWNEFLESAVTCNIDPDLDISLLPPENIAVLSIEEFDLLMAYIEQKIFTLDEILGIMVEENSSVATMKMSFIQHLPSVKNITLNLSYLDSTFESHSKRIEGIFSK